MALGDKNFISRKTADDILRTINTVDNLSIKKDRKPRRRIRSLGGGAAGGNFALCSITGKASDSSYNVSVQTGNPLSPDAEVKTGLLHFLYATTNGVAIGAQVMALIYESTSGVDFDCFPIETTMNLVAPPEEEEE